MSGCTLRQHCQRQCALRQSTGPKIPFASASLGRGKVGFGPAAPMPMHQALPLKTALQRRTMCAQVFPFDQAWAPSVDAASLAPQLFATSLFPYLCFLFFLTKSGKTPPLTLFGFYFLLVFVGATIPAGIYAKSHYGTSLANVDWLHGAAESLLTVTNLFIVLGLRKGIRDAEEAKAAKAAEAKGGAAERPAPAAAAAASASASEAR